jgi:hypothetical protein
MRMPSGLRPPLRAGNHAVGEAAAVRIDASMGDWRQKAVQQKAVGTEEFMQ